MIYDVIVDGKAHRLELNKAGAGWACRLDGKEIHVDAVLPRRDVLSLLVDGHVYEVKREQTVTDLNMSDRQHALRGRTARSALSALAQRVARRTRKDRARSWL